VCSVTLVSIEGGVYGHDIKNRSFWPGTGAIEVTVRVTVEKGIVQVWLEDPQKNKTLVRVKPGETAEFTGVAMVFGSASERQFSVYFEPLGDTKRAENVQAEIRYDTQHTISKSPRNSATEVSSAVGSSERVEHVKMGPRSFLKGRSKYDTLLTTPATMPTPELSRFMSNQPTWRDPDAANRAMREFTERARDASGLRAQLGAQADEIFRLA
jgi:hypothetical protein